MINFFLWLPVLLTKKKKFFLKNFAGLYAVREKFPKATEISAMPSYSIRGGLNSPKFGRKKFEGRIRKGMSQ